VAEGRNLGDGADGGEELGRLLARQAAQQEGPRAQGDA
jgi:hypothetical protein